VDRHHLRPAPPALPSEHLRYRLGVRQGHPGRRAHLARGRERLHAPRNRGRAHDRRPPRHPGAYSIFIDAKDGTWTFVLSSWAAQQKFDRNDKSALWGAYGYTPDKDVLRAPMTLSTLPFSVEELTWSFVDMTEKGGRMAIMWEKTMAAVAFGVM
jgi:hypothetical protein